MNNDNGGFAFPTDRALQAKGMTLRDYFAAKAMAGMIANPGNEGEPKFFASIAYEMADAMLKERAK